MARIGPRGAQNEARKYNDRHEDGQKTSFCERTGLHISDAATTAETCREVFNFSSGGQQ